MSQELYLLSLLLLLPGIYFLFFRSSKSQKSAANDNYSSLIPANPVIEQVKKYSDKDIKEIATTHAVWTIGLSKSSISVSEESVLRLMEFSSVETAISAELIVAVLKKAMFNPVDLIDDLNSAVDVNKLIRKPSVAAFLTSDLLNDELIASVAKSMQKFEIRITTHQKLAPEMGDIVQKRRIELYRQQKAAAYESIQNAKNMTVEFIPQPPRGCFSCKNEISGKASQCSACKAILYCGTDCAKKDWPMHKQLCASFKRNMLQLTAESLHTFPFDFYPLGKPLCNYNQVNLLVQNGVHNLGIYRRLCSCYQNTAYGELEGERLETIEAVAITDPKEKFDMLCLSSEWFPLDEKLKDSRKIFTWKQLYEAKGIPANNIGALVFDYALTLWHFINKYSIDPAETSKGRKQITIHMLGVQNEIDLVPTFEILLGLLPENIDLAIHMIGPSISPKLSEKHRYFTFMSNSSKSSIIITLNRAHYSTEYQSGEAIAKSWKSLPFGRGAPSLVVILNANILGEESWIEAVKLLVEKNQKTLITEQMSQGIEALGRNLPAIGGRLSLESTANPFRHPVYQFKRDTNLPGWSNAFYGGIF